jgi:hypothetical protein
MTNFPRFRHYIKEETVSVAAAILYKENYTPATIIRDNTEIEYL